MKLYVQNTIWLISPPSSARQGLNVAFSKQSRERGCATDVKFSLGNSEGNNNGKTPTILLIVRFTEENGS